MATSKTKTKPKPKIKPIKAIKTTKKKSGAKKKVSPIARQARRLNLESLGYGRWGKMGVVTHRTSGGKLVAVKDSKTNRVLKRDGKAKANSLLTKMIKDHNEKVVKIRTAIKRAEGLKDEAKVKSLQSLLDKTQASEKKNRERLALLSKRKKAAQAKAA